jgi:hypothetical protein
MGYILRYIFDGHILLDDSPEVNSHILPLKPSNPAASNPA